MVLRAQREIEAESFPIRLPERAFVPLQQRVGGAGGGRVDGWKRCADRVGEPHRLARLVTHRLGENVLPSSLANERGDRPGPGDELRFLVQLWRARDFVLRESSRAAISLARLGRGAIEHGERGGVKGNQVSYPWCSRQARTHLGATAVDVGDGGTRCVDADVENAH